MELVEPGAVAVIFAAQRTLQDAAGYAEAAAAMVELAMRQPGYLHIDSARGDDGFGITVSYWESDAAARAWRDHPDHEAIRKRGRDRWYSGYSLHVARVERRYGWAATATDVAS